MFETPIPARAVRKWIYPDTQAELNAALVPVHEASDGDVVALWVNIKPGSTNPLGPITMCLSIKGETPNAGGRIIGLKSPLREKVAIAALALHDDRNIPRIFAYAREMKRSRDYAVEALFMADGVLVFDTDAYMAPRPFDEDDDECQTWLRSNAIYLTSMPASSHAHLEMIPRMKGIASLLGGFIKMSDENSRIIRFKDPTLAGLSEA